MDRINLSDEMSSQLQDGSKAKAADAEVGVFDEGDVINISMAETSLSEYEMAEKRVPDLLAKNQELEARLARIQEESKQAREEDIAGGRAQALEGQQQQADELVQRMEAEKARRTHAEAEVAQERAMLERMAEEVKETREAAARADAERAKEVVKRIEAERMRDAAEAEAKRLAEQMATAKAAPAPSAPPKKRGAR